MKGLAILLALIALTTEASAQGRVYYSADGKVVARSTTGTGNATVTYDATSGKIISREAIIGNTIVVYDASGRIVGRIMGEKR